MSKTMFEVCKYSSIPKIKPVEVERITEKSVWIRGLRCKKETNGEKFFESHQEAKDWLLERSKRRIEAFERRLKSEKQNLALIQAIVLI